ncbi:hypothetical protein N0V86_009697 [Didymella sp. IMI 355093]|nr:hypothetical protein N0V86_009697 [Didymella sp. IMI 355093]
MSELFNHEPQITRHNKLGLNTSPLYQPRVSDDDTPYDLDPYKSATANIEHFLASLFKPTTEAIFRKSPRTSELAIRLGVLRNAYVAHLIGEASLLYDQQVLDILHQALIGIRFQEVYIFQLGSNREIGTTDVHLDQEATQSNIDFVEHHSSSLYF